MSDNSASGGFGSFVKLPHESQLPAGPVDEPARDEDTAPKAAPA